MSRVVSALLTVTLLSTSVWGDVIPSRRADGGSQEARRQVADRLQSMGLTVDRATAQADGLMDAEARYFADNPDRVQLAGREDGGGSYFPTMAFVEGVVLLTAAIAVGAYYYTVNN